MITYRFTLEGISPEQLNGFFTGWPNPPSSEVHYTLLQNSDEVIIAVDETSTNVVGFITAITDKVLAAYIPFLEVVGDYQGRGIGKELISLMLDRLKGYYMIDLLCDSDQQDFYEHQGMSRATGMSIRNYEAQSGETTAHLG